MWGKDLLPVLQAKVPSLLGGENFNNKDLNKITSIFFHSHPV